MRSAHRRPPPPLNACARAHAQVEARLGPALETLDALLGNPEEEGVWDFAFVDADKRGYRDYYERLLRLLRPGGVIAGGWEVWCAGGRVGGWVDGRSQAPSRPLRLPPPPRPPAPLPPPSRLHAVDNVLWYGRVSDPAVSDAATAALRELNAFLLTDPRIALSIVPVGDGVALCRKL